MIQPIPQSPQEPVKTPDQNCRLRDITLIYTHILETVDSMPYSEANKIIALSMVLGDLCVRDAVPEDIKKLSELCIRIIKETIDQKNI